MTEIKMTEMKFQNVIIISPKLSWCAEFKTQLKETQI